MNIYLNNILQSGEYYIFYYYYINRFSCCIIFALTLKYQLSRLGRDL